MSDHAIVWVDNGDGINDKGMRYWHDEDGYHAEVFIRRKPGLSVMEDPYAITLREFGHDD
jgi:hypothetical protein